MKTRHGWVSNSSTTSFCIMGESFDLNDLEEKFSETNDFSLDETLEEKIRSSGDEMAYYFVDANNESVYLGYDIFTMKDDETKKQFAARTKKMIKKVFGLDSKPNFIVETDLES